MLSFDWNTPPGAPRTLLCLGAHSDDIEIGCGGTILKWLAANPGCSVHWVVFSAAGHRGSEARAGAAAFLAEAQAHTVTLHEFRDGFFPSQVREIKEVFEDIKSRVTPDLIFTHYRDDAHQDHRTLCELTWNTWRNHTILEYEIPKYDGDLGRPNIFVPLERAQCEAKIEYLHRAFDSQRGKQWFDDELFYALLRLRGMEANAPGRYAEAFYARKLCLA